MFEKVWLISVFSLSCDTTWFHQDPKQKLQTTAQESVLAVALTRMDTHAVHKFVRGYIEPVQHPGDRGRCVGGGIVFLMRHKTEVLTTVPIKDFLARELGILTRGFCPNSIPVTNSFWPKIPLCRFCCVWNYSSPPVLCSCAWFPFMAESVHLYICRASRLLEASGPDCTTKKK